MSEKPQPLDLKDIILKDDLKEQFDIVIDTLTTGGVDNKEEAITLIHCLLEAFQENLKQRIKSACEFYSRYKDNPELLIQEHPEYENTLTRFLKDLPFAVPFNEKMFNPLYFDYKKYNKWLFKLAFKDVFEEVENGEE